MEFCSGGDLNRFIHAHRTLSQNLAKQFLQQLASALLYMRTKNVSHMDLKPQNILLSSQTSPTLKIADFGFAHYLLGDTEAAMLRGSPLYMAPEIILSRQYNEKADLWSTGVILYECLFGRAPFHSNSFSELEEKIVDTKPIELPHAIEISDDCRDLLLGLLQRDPDRRMAYEDFLQHRFIDLEHRPSADALPKARDLVLRAVDKDSTGDFSEAIRLYCDALQYFVPAIRYEEDLVKKQTLRGKVREYMGRAEELKSLTKATTTDEVLSSTGSAQENYAHLVDVYSSNSRIQSVLKLVNAADNKRCKEDFSGALQQYELALGIALPILQGELEPLRKELLQNQVKRWMSEAERIKTCQDVRKLRIIEDAAKHDEDLDKSLRGQCIIQ